MVTTLLLWLNDPWTKLIKANARDKRDAQDDCNLKEHQLKLSNGNMVNAADAKLTVQPLSFKAVQVLNHIWPKVDDVVAGKFCSFLNANDCEKKKC